MFKLRWINNRTDNSFSKFLLLQTTPKFQKRCFVESRRRTGQRTATSIRRLTWVVKAGTSFGNVDILMISSSGKVLARLRRWMEAAWRFWCWLLVKLGKLRREIRAWLNASREGRKLIAQPPGSSFRALHCQHCCCTTPQNRITLASTY